MVPLAHEEDLAWGELVDDADAIWLASVAAAKAYRALTGPLPERAALRPELTDGFLGPLVAILSGWANHARPAVDVARARRLFWVHWLGPALFAASFPDEVAPMATDFALHEVPPHDGAWALCRRVAEPPRRADPGGTLISPWPADVTLLVLGSLDLLDHLPRQSAGGRVRFGAAGP